MNRFVERFAEPRVIGWAALAAVLLTLSSLDVGMQQDDYYHLLALKPPAGYPIQLPGWDLFHFTGDAERARASLSLGFSPWWTLPELNVSFFRPLTSITHWLDYTLVGVPWIMHAHSVLWYALLVLVVAWLLFRIEGGAVFGSRADPRASTFGSRADPRASTAGIAALLYAADDAHGLPVGFLAARNALTSAAAGVLVLLVHDAWRRGFRHGVWLGPLCFAVALWFGEGALGCVGYLVAHALFLDRAPWRSRLLAGSGYLAVLVGWRVLYASAGYGTFGSSYYLDPGRTPGQFLLALPERVAILLLGEFGFPPSDLYAVLPGERLLPLLLVAGVLFLWMAAACMPLLREDVRLRFWLTGAVLAAIPVSATWPNDRMLLFVGVGGSAVVAKVLVTGARLLKERAVPLWWRRTTLGLAGLFVLIHVVMGPLLLPLRAWAPKAFFGPQKAAAAELPVSAARHLIVVNAEEWLLPAFSVAFQVAEHSVLPGGFLLMGATRGGGTVTRIDARTLVLAHAGGFFQDAISRVTRGTQYPLRLNEEVRVPECRIRVLALTADGRPERVQFAFEQPLESARYDFRVAVGNGRFAPFAPPAPGASVPLAAL